MKLRSKDREFHGLQGELRAINLVIRERFERSKDIKHPRDLGAEREGILKSFLAESGLIPQKYGVSRCSSRVVGGNGRISNEMDIVIYDTRDSIILKKYDNILEFFAAETVYGAISVKSRLNKIDIKEGIKNIVSYKSVYDGRENNSSSSVSRGFGILFAYTSDLSDRDLHDEIKKCSEIYDTRLLPNIVFVLDRANFMYGDEDGGYALNKKIDMLNFERIYSNYYITGDGLFNFYNVTMTLLRDRIIGEIDVNKYFNLPLVIDNFCYYFTFGAASEEFVCEKHGHYLRRIRTGRIAKIVEFMNNNEQIEFLRAIDLGQGKPGTDEESYKKQPGWVYLYNPDNYPLDKIMFGSQGTNRFDELVIEGRHIWVPWVYWVKEKIYNDCPRCEAEAKKKSRRKSSSLPSDS